MTALDLDGMLRRLHLPTVRRLYPECELRAEAEDQSYRDFLATIIAEEVAHRAQTRIERSVRKARFPFLRTIEEFDFTFQSSIRLQLLGSCLGPELVSEGRSLILCGPSGTGKTHLAIAIAYRAIQNGYEALFTSAAEMIETLSGATRRGELARALAHYTHPSVLVIDEVGYLTVGGDAANLMFQVVNERYLHRRPMIFTTNKALAAWGLVLHDPDLAEAILDRVLERGRLVELRGASYRTRHLKRAESDRSPLREGAIISGNQVPDFPEPTAIEVHHTKVVLGASDSLLGQGMLEPERRRVVTPRRCGQTVFKWICVHRPPDTDRSSTARTNVILKRRNAGIDLCLPASSPRGFGGGHFGFHSRLSRWASAICSGVMRLVNLSRNSEAFFAP
jgi:DNA replication protein DnaC